MAAEVREMPMTAERERLTRNILRLPEKQLIAVSALVDGLLDDEPPLSADEMDQIAGASEDMAEGRMIPWDELKQQLETLP